MIIKDTDGDVQSGNDIVRHIQDRIVGYELQEDGETLGLLEINPEIETKNGLFTFLLPGNEIKMDCKEAR